MLLIITNRYDPDANLIIKELHRRKIDFIRFNQDELNSNARLSWNSSTEESKIITKRLTIRASDIRKGWLQQLSLPITRELSDYESFAQTEYNTQLVGFWDDLQIEWFNSPLSVMRANKIKQISKAREAGLRVPNTIISSDIEEIKKFYLKNNEDCIYKTLESGILKLDGKEYSAYTKKLDATILSIDGGISQIPMIIQERIDKIYELRVVFIDGNIISAKIDSQNIEKTSLDWRRDAHYIQRRLSTCDIPHDIKCKITKFMMLMDLKYGALDMIYSHDGDYVFLEVNSCGSWDWMQRGTGLPILDTIVDSLSN